MSYKMLPFFTKPVDRVGMYLQYLPETTDEIVDATFCLRLKGRRKFDVEWRAGMRFVHKTKSNLAEGLANDFGAHFMQTQVLQDFLGLANDNLDDPTPIQAHIQVTIHNSSMEFLQDTNPNTYGGSSPSLREEMKQQKKDYSKSFFGAFGDDIRTPPPTSPFEHNSDLVRVGRIVVPILTRLSQRPKLFQLGAYPGVEYRILRILWKGQERFTSCPGAEYELKPIYPLVQQLERPWPVTVNEQDIPKMYTPNMYNAVSALGSLLTAVVGLATAYIISQAVSIFFIPSRSMDPTLQVGDVLLVDKVTPRLFHQQQRVGDVVLFSPPSKLRDIVAANGGTLTPRDLFVKRIAAESGDVVAVDATGKTLVNQMAVVGDRDLCQSARRREWIEQYVQPKDQIVLKEEVFVLGDCSSVSIDSRVWGPLDGNEIVGKPIIR